MKDLQVLSFELKKNVGNSRLPCNLAFLASWVDACPSRLGKYTAAVAVEQVDGNTCWDSLLKMEYPPEV